MNRELDMDVSYESWSGSIAVSGAGHPCRSDLWQKLRQPSSVTTVALNIVSGKDNAQPVGLEYLSEVRLSGPSSTASPKSRGGFAGTTATVQKLSEIDLIDLPRFSSGFAELDRVLGGGFVPGSAI